MAEEAKWWSEQNIWAVVLATTIAIVATLFTRKAFSRKSSPSSRPAAQHSTQHNTVAHNEFTANLTLEQLRNQLQQFAQEREWGQFHIPRNLVLAMVGEVGEVAEHFQWKSDQQCAPLLPGWTDTQREALGEELSDVLCYLVRLSDVCGVDLATAVQNKIRKNAAKYPVDKARCV
eukprot:c7964_g1_i1.p1 GENE.c7964_g1_i1~~c7964_g1_i1.p1  ORF type:complete len:175 (-),score=39.77 c7964_g1_i1:57-581(-)